MRAFVLALALRLVLTSLLDIRVVLRPMALAAVILWSSWNSLANGVRMLPDSPDTPARPKRRSPRRVLRLPRASKRSISLRSRTMRYSANERKDQTRQGLAAR